MGIGQLPLSRLFHLEADNTKSKFRHGSGEVPNSHRCYQNLSDDSKVALIMDHGMSRSAESFVRRDINNEKLADLKTNSVLCVSHYSPPNLKHFGLRQECFQKDV